MMDYKIPKLPLPFDLENKAVLKQANLANRQLAELKFVFCILLPMVFLICQFFI